MFTIIQDTKEKLPWDFTVFKDVKSQVKKGLKTGDYTVKGFEDQICIERKRSTSEISLNLGIKFKQFDAEFQRMQDYKYRCVICEFPMWLILDFPNGSGIPKYKWKYLRINGKFLYKRLMDLSYNYTVPVYFTNTSIEAQEVAMNVIREACQQS